MDMMTLLGRIEKNFFNKLDDKLDWHPDQIKIVFDKAIKEVLVLTYSRIMRDAGKSEKGGD